MIYLGVDILYSFYLKLIKLGYNDFHQIWSFQLWSFSFLCLFFVCDTLIVFMIMCRSIPHFSKVPFTYFFYFLFFKLQILSYLSSHLLCFYQVKSTLKLSSKCFLLSLWFSKSIIIWFLKYFIFLFWHLLLLSAIIHSLHYLDIILFSSLNIFRKPDLMYLPVKSNISTPSIKH